MQKSKQRILINTHHLIDGRTIRYSGHAGHGKQRNQYIIEELIDGEFRKVKSFGNDLIACREYFKAMLSGQQKLVNSLESVLCL